MPYLSKIYLNPLRRQTQRLLRNPQDLHAAVLGGVPEQPVTQRVLWRVEPRPQARANLLVLTQTMPSWEHLVEQAGWSAAESTQWQTASLDPLIAQIHVGRRFGLRLTANPVVSVSSGKSGGRGKVVPVKRNEQLLWLAQRLPRWGFQPLLNSLDEPTISPVHRQRYEFIKRDKNRVTLESATFDAFVEVCDSDLARRSVLEGVGRAKAYGCGLITLAAPDRA